MWDAVLEELLTAGGEAEGPIPTLKRTLRVKENLRLRVDLLALF